MEEFFNAFGKLYENFGLWTLAFTVGLTLVMIPVNLLWKKVMQKESLQRLRKTTSALSVYILALAIILSFTAIFHKELIVDINYITSSTISLGFCSQLLWAIIKFVKDYGIMALAAIVNNSDWKKIVNSISTTYGIDSKITNIIITRVENYLDTTEGSNLDILVKDELKIVNDLKSKLTGFVESDKVETVAKDIVSKIKEVFTKENKA